MMQRGEHMRAAFSNFMGGKMPNERITCSNKYETKLTTNETYDEVTI